MSITSKQTSLLAALLAQSAEFAIVGGVAVNAQSLEFDRSIPFQQVWSTRVEAKVGDLLVPFIIKADLIQNKLEIGRHRDLADVEELQAIPGDIFPDSFAPPPLPRPE